MESPSSLSLHRVDLPSVLPADYAERRARTEARRLVLLLHGYEQDGKGLLERCESVLPDEANAVAPNGLFPLPRKVERSYRIGFSWYFYNPYTDQYFIDPSYGARFAQALLERVNPSKLPVTIVGFSQGGYIAPFIAREVKEVDHIIGMGCQFLDDEIDVTELVKRKIRMDAIHGANDEIASPDDARRSHEALKAAGIRGEFILLPGAEHRIDSAMRLELGKLLAKAN